MSRSPASERAQTAGLDRDDQQGLAVGGIAGMPASSKDRSHAGIDVIILVQDLLNRTIFGRTR